PAARLAKLELGLRPYRFAHPEVLALLAALLSLPHPAGAPPLRLSPERQKQQTQEALVAWVLEEAERQPVLAVCGDPHRADPPWRESPGVLMDQTPTSRTLLVLTCRPQFRLPWGSRSYLTQMTLTRLTRPQVSALVHGLTRGKALPPAVVRQIGAQTDGV